MTETQLRQKYIRGLLALEGKCAEGTAEEQDIPAEEALNILLGGAT